MKDKISLLDTIPTHAHHVWTEQDSDGCLVLVYHRFPKAWLSKLFSRWYSPLIHVPLEQFGSEVWLLMDGIRTTEEVIHEVVMRHPDEEYFPQRLALYISRLHHDGLIELKVTSCQ